MALHGDICANGRIIGTWSATSTDRSGTNPEPVYECHARSKDDDITARFTVTHRRADGAIALTAAVMAKAATILRPRGRR